MLLESSGFEVSQAANGKQAVSAIRQRPDGVSLVILDMTMPEMNGEEALNEIRSIRPGMPVLVISGYREQDAAGRFRQEQPSAFIQKPFEFETLLAKIQAVLELEPPG
jgi:DNA-binding NtrC family response regulator